VFGTFGLHIGKLDIGFEIEVTVSARSGKQQALPPFRLGSGPLSAVSFSPEGEDQGQIDESRKGIDPCYLIRIKKVRSYLHEIYERLRFVDPARYLGKSRFGNRET
jgi:hypothetical protein